MSDSTVVLYHGPHCADGWAACWAAWTSLGDSAVYVPVNYGQPPPPEIDGEVSQLFILDFSYPRVVLERLAECCKEILVLDHHVTARADLEGLPFARFDMGKSGAVMAWEHFRPGEPVPLLLQYVQDRDLWRWELPDSREFSAALAVEPREFARWDELSGLLGWAKPYHEFIDRGAGILAAQSVHVASLCDHAFMVDVGGHRVPAVNSPVFQSEVGEELCRRHPEAPFAACFAVDESDEVWSLRSRNGFDVSRVAKSLGGGGHAAAAGFRKPR